MHEGSRRAIVAACLANFAIAIAKFVGFFFTGAASMLAEAVHSVADTTNQGLLLLGGNRARQEATETHQFGYGRERYFWAFVVALVIFSLGSVFALYEGITKLRHPHEVESLGWAVGILTLSIAFEAFSFRTAVVEANQVRAGRSWWEFVRHSKSPELPVVLLEDFGALVGLALALAGVTAAHLTHNARFDAVGSVSIGLLLGAIATTLVIEMKSLLIGEAASPAMTRSIQDAITGAPTVVNVIHLRTEHLGPEQLLVAAKVEFDRALDIQGLARAIDQVEVAVRAAVPEAALIYLEPDITRE